MKQRNFIILCFLLAIIAVLGGLWISKAILSKSTDIVIGKQGTVENPTIDFGAIYYGQAAASRQFPLYNASNFALTLSDETSCGCTQVNLFPSIIPAGGNSLAKISFQPGLVGNAEPAMENFMIYDTSGKDPVSEVEGLVKVFLLPALQFDQTSVNWGFIPGEQTVKAQTITAQNVLSVPIQVEWNSIGEGAFFSVSPATAVITAGDKIQFLFKPLPILSTIQNPQTEIAILQGKFQSKEGPISLKFIFRVFATPEPIFQAIPGALVISPDSNVQSINRTITLVSGPDIGEPPRVLEVTTSNPALHAVLKGSEIQMTLDVKKIPKIFQGDIVVVYSYKGTKSTIDIPVFVAPNMAG